ncbi:unnamed protein product [Ambrosiozyma monospora]|uniref:Unnamed protein product n=1 Tax=Ambrosiozyma monospora TaxID=43982 RepID=A0A9W6Z416_AMBMO|nr:unnamed protein product [Ambrosiozyma monospora]
MDDLVRGDPADYDPRLFMFLPSDMGGNKIRYKNSKLSAKKLSSWSRRLLSFYSFNETSYKELGNKMNLNRNLPSLGGVAELQSDPKVAFIFLYDKETLVPEDELILHQLVQPIMDLNRNAYIYKSSDTEKFLRLIEQRETELTNKYLNEYVEEGEEKLQFDKGLFDAKTLSTFPMMLCIKENTLLSPVYQSFSSRDMRDIGKIINFIKTNADPTYEELNLYSKKQVFPTKFDSNIHDYTEKVVVAILDDNDYTDMFKKSYYLTFINQSLNYVKEVFQYKNLLAKRKLKYEEVERVGPRRALKALKKKIDNVFKTPEYRVSTVYMTRTTLLFSQKWWPYIDVSKYNVGDAFIVSRFENQYWDNHGKPFKLDEPKLIIDTINEANFNGLKGMKMNNSLEIFSTLKTLSIFGVLVFVALKLVKRYKRSNRVSLLPVHHNRLPFKKS